MLAFEGVLSSPLAGTALSRHVGDDSLRFHRRGPGNVHLPNPESLPPQAGNDHVEGFVAILRTVVHSREPLLTRNSTTESLTCKEC